MLNRRAAPVFVFFSALMEQTNLLNKAVNEMLSQGAADGAGESPHSTSTEALQYSLAHDEEDPRDRSYQLAATDEVYETGGGAVDIEPETYIRDDASSRRLVEIACMNLGRTDGEAARFAEVLQKEEWFVTVGELREALADLSAWVGLRLPTRLKMELKRLILWRLVFDHDTQVYYLENSSTGETHDFGGQGGEEWEGGVTAVAAHEAASASALAGGAESTAILTAKVDVNGRRTAAIASTAGEGGGEEWACANCTFINKGRDTEKCIVCRLPRLQGDGGEDEGPG